MFNFVPSGIIEKTEKKISFYLDHISLKKNSSYMIVEERKK